MWHLRIDYFPFWTHFRPHYQPDIHKIPATNDTGSPHRDITGTWTLGVVLAEGIFELKFQGKTSANWI